MVKCPHCKVELINTDSINSEYAGDSYFDSMIGECPECKKVFRWTEQYKFFGISEFEEDEEGVIYV